MVILAIMFGFSLAVNIFVIAAYNEMMKVNKSLKEDKKAS